jgi:toxin co-regulated pilus biosynthesis protein Q
MQRLRFGVGLKLLLCCTWAMCVSAFAADQQVIVEGAHRAADTVRTSGHAVPLLHAIEQVVPASYSVNVPNAGPWADAPVSWHAGGSFVHVLGELLSGDPTLQAHVDTDLHLVTVTAHPALRQPALAAWPSAASSAQTQTQAAATVTQQAPVAGAPGIPLAVASATPAPSAPPALPASSASPAIASMSAASVVAAAASAPAAASEAPPVQTTWELRRSDGSVRNALARWASDAGWQFIWDVPTDFTVDADATIHGTLEHALHAVANALGNSQVPIQIVMYQGNRVLRVIPKGAG